MTPSLLLWRTPDGLGPEFSKGGFVVQLLWEGGGAKAGADVFRRDLSSKIIWEGF